MTRPTLDTILAKASADTRRRNPAAAALLDAGALLANYPRHGTAVPSNPATGGQPAPKHGQTPAGLERAGKRFQARAPNGRCPHTGRAYRSKTEARWATEHPEHRFEPVGIRTACGVYWPDFVWPRSELGDGFAWPLQPLYEVKGAYIRDRAMHKVKAAIRPARAMGFAGIWLAQWTGKEWRVTEACEG